jgi:hypothetical protein
MFKNHKQIDHSQERTIIHGRMPKVQEFPNHDTHC